MNAPPPIVVVGAGGHGKVVCDALLAAGEDVLGFLDDGVTAGTLVLGLPVLGTSAWLAGRTSRVALGIGSNDVRRRLAEVVEAKGSTLATVVHPRAVIARGSVLEPGAVVLAQAVVNPDAVVGRGAIVNTAAVVEHDCRVGAFAHVSPNATLGGNCHVGAFAQLGIGATMLPGTRIGERTVVGGGAMVARDLPDGVVARGVPARVARHLNVP